MVTGSAKAKNEDAYNIVLDTLTLKFNKKLRNKHENIIN